MRKQLTENIREILTKENVFDGENKFYISEEDLKKLDNVVYGEGFPKNRLEKELLIMGLSLDRDKLIIQKV